MNMHKLTSHCFLLFFFISIGCVLIASWNSSDIIFAFQITCVFGLYIWCAAADPADPGVFRSKKYLNIPDNEKHAQQKDSKLGGEPTSSMHDANASTVGGKSLEKDATLKGPNTEIENKNVSSGNSSCFLLALFPCAFICNHCSLNDESSEEQMSEDGMFYCSLCEVEVGRSN